MTPEDYKSVADLAMRASEVFQAEIERLTAENCDLKARGAYLVAEVRDAWDKGRISVDTFHAALELGKVTGASDSTRQLPEKIQCALCGAICPEPHGPECTR